MANKGPGEMHPINLAQVAKADSIVNEVRTKLEFLRRVLTYITDTSFSNEETLQHWELILSHRNHLSRTLSRETNLMVAIIDYFTHVHSILKNPIVVEHLLLERLQKHASVDFLTNVYNRQFFYEAITREISRASRSKTQFSLLFFDIDNFKYFNDTYGHQKGDTILQGVASVIKSLSRAQDVPCRYGGDEFISLLPDTNFFHAVAIAERIKKNTAPLPSEMGLQTQLTISYGIATYPVDGSQSDELIKVCDTRLYMDKNNKLELRRKSITEKRGHPRFKILRNSGILLKNLHTKIEVQMLDIGLRGLSFIAEEPPEVGLIYQMQLFLEPPLGAARAEVEALYLQNLAAGRFRAGCRLRAISFL